MIDMIIDKKLSCCSLMKSMSILDYLSFVDNVYERKGGIQGQRDALKQKTAITIRERMIKDISEGTILPPIVIGVIVSDERYEQITNESNENINITELIKSIDNNNISIIDGMQRTTAIKKAISENPSIGDNIVRVEFWISKNVNSLIYRMLVLNTGQVPWNIRRQIEIVFGGVINTIKDKVDNINIIKIDDNKRRKKGGDYNADALIEMFLAFGARTWKIETKEKLTDEFTRGDFVQSSSETDVVISFCRILSSMVKLDILLDEKIAKDSTDNSIKFSAGRDLFSSGPAKIGFAAACGIEILGRPGVERDKDTISKKLSKVEDSINNIITKINAVDDVAQFLDFETLSDMTAKIVGKIGSYERELFYYAFKTMIEEDGNIDSFTICWRAK